MNSCPKGSRTKQVLPSQFMSLVAFLVICFSFIPVNSISVATAAAPKAQPQAWPDGLYAAYSNAIRPRLVGVLSQTQEITAGDNAAGDNFGTAVSVSSDGSTALIGTPYHNVGTSNSAGAAYIFTRSGNTWSQTQELTAGDAATNDYFGNAVSISGDGNTILVGAYDHTVSGHNGAGTAYIFTKSGSSFSQTQELSAGDNAANDSFGYALSLSNDGNTALIGAYNHTINNNSSAGAAYIFTRSGSSFSQAQELSAGDAAANDFFGYGLSLSNDGNTALIGAYNHKVSGNSNAGAAYIFTKSGSSFSQAQELTAGDAAASDIFGQAVSISSDGSTVLISADQHKVGSNSNAGAAYIFTKSGSTWGQSQELIANDSATNNYFSYAVSLSSDGSTALIGALNRQAGNNNNAGGAYVFIKNGSTFSQSAILVATDNAANDQFGDAVSLSSDGSTALVGAYGHQVGSNGTAGSAYVFTAPPVSTTTSLTSSSNPAVFGQPITFTATVSPTAATGSVIFSDTTNNVQIGATTTISNGVATLVIGNLAVGSHTIVATYVGNTSYATSTSNSVNQVVTQANTTTSLTSSPNPSNLNQSVSFTATVTVIAPGVSTPTGSVVFTDTTNNVQIGATATISNGVATVVTSNLAVGSHNIIARYSGDTNDTASTSTSITQTVVPFSSTISLTSSSNAIIVGQPITFTATVSPTVATGSVVFSDTTTHTQVGATTTITNGVATVVTSNLNVGSHTIVATYGGNSSYATSTSNPVTVTVSSAPNPSYTYNLPYLSNGANNSTTYPVFQNIGSAATGVSVTFYDVNGNPLSPQPSLTGNCNSVPLYGECILPNPFTSTTGSALATGSATIVSPQPLNVIIPESTAFGGSAYAINSGASGNLIVPIALNQAYGDFTTAITVYNSGTITANVTLKFFNGGDGSPAPPNSSQTFSLAPHTSRTFDQSQASSNLPSGFNGWATVTGSDANSQLLVAQVLETSLSRKFVAIANAQTQARTTLYAPAIFNGAYGGFFTGANIVNPNSTPVTVTVTYFDLNGNSTSTAPFVLPPNAVQGIYQGNTSGNGLPANGLAPQYVGAAQITATGGGVIVVVNEDGGRTSTGNEKSGTYAATASGSATVGLPVIANGAFGGYITGDTILNTTSSTVNATLTYYNLDGSPVSGVSPVSFSIGPNASQAVYQGASTLPPGFYGTVVIKVTGNSPANALIVTTNAQSNALFYTYTEPNQ